MENKYQIKQWQHIENLSDQPVKNLNVQIISEGITVTQLKDSDFKLIPITDVNNNVIEEIPANGIVSFYLPAKVNRDVTEILATLKVTDNDGNIYRANKVIKEVESEGAKIFLTTPNDGEYVGIGDEIIYNITVENTTS